MPDHACTDVETILGPARALRARAGKIYGNPQGVF